MHLTEATSSVHKLLIRSAPPLSSISSGLSIILLST